MKTLFRCFTLAVAILQSTANPAQDEASPAAAGAGGSSSSGRSPMITGNDGVEGNQGSTYNTFQQGRANTIYIPDNYFNQYTSSTTGIANSGGSTAASSSSDFGDTGNVYYAPQFAYMDTNGNQMTSNSASSSNSNTGQLVYNNANGFYQMMYGPNTPTAPGYATAVGSSRNFGNTGNQWQSQAPYITNNGDQAVSSTAYSSGNDQSSAQSSSSSSGTANSMTNVNNAIATTNTKSATASNGMDTFQFTPIPTPRSSAPSVTNIAKTIVQSKELLDQINNSNNVQKRLQTEMTNTKQQLMTEWQLEQEQANGWYISVPELVQAFQNSFNIMNDVAVQTERYIDGAGQLLGAMTAAGNIHLDPAWVNLVIMLQKKADDAMVNLNQSMSLVKMMFSQVSSDIGMFRKYYDEQFQQTDSQIQAALNSVANAIQTLGIKLSDRMAEAKGIAISWLKEAKTDASTDISKISAVMDPVITYLKSLTGENLAVRIEGMFDSIPEVLSILYNGQVSPRKIKGGKTRLYKDLINIVNDFTPVGEAATGSAIASGVSTSSSTISSTGNSAGDSTTANALSSSSSTTSSSSASSTNSATYTNA